MCVGSFVCDWVGDTGTEKKVIKRGKRALFARAASNNKEGVVEVCSGEEEVTVEGSSKR